MRPITGLAVLKITAMFAGNSMRSFAVAIKLTKKRNREIAPVTTAFLCRI
jgi:hypothetical protein